MNYDQCFSYAVEKKYKLNEKENINVSNDFHIAYGIDNNYARCAAVSIASICENNKDLNFIFHIMASNLNEKNIDGIKDIAFTFDVQIIIYQINIHAFKALPVQEHLPISTYYRFILPLLLDVPKILYLDADIICLKNIEKLFEVNLDHVVVAAVPDTEYMGRKRNAALGLKNHRYFNAGMLLINVVKWNQNNIVQKVMNALIKEPQKFRYLDQDALNFVLAGQVHILNKKYNCLNMSDMNCVDIVFFHFAAHPKPWNIAWPISEACNEFTRDLYQKYEMLTPWKDEPKIYPRNYKEMKNYGHCLFKHGQKYEATKWYMKYIITKFLKIYKAT